MATEPRFYHHERLDVYECLGCGAFLEVPHMAVVKAGRRPVPVKDSPENRLLWIELMVELDHAACGRFKDAQMAEEARRFHQPVLVQTPRGRNEQRNAPKPSGLAS